MVYDPEDASTLARRVRADASRKIHLGEDDRVGGGIGHAAGAVAEAISLEEINCNNGRPNVVQGREMVEKCP